MYEPLPIQSFETRIRWKRTQSGNAGRTVFSAFISHGLLERQQRQREWFRYAGVEMSIACCYFNTAMHSPRIFLGEQ